jgi:hypothetical protein
MLFLYMCEPQQCFADHKEAKRCEVGEEVLSINLHEVKILLSNLTPKEKDPKGSFLNTGGRYAPACLSW